MILAEPPPSNYDLRFSLFGVPVRVHPLFWLVAVLLGAKLKEPVTILMWVGVIFVSILVHEFGHVAAFRYFGMRSDVVLHSFGGLAIARRYQWRGNWAQVLISFAGPLAGFVFAALIFLAMMICGVPFRIYLSMPEVVDYRFQAFEPYNLARLVDFLLQVNLYWGIVNLLPIYPLDGGQIARALLEQFRVPDAVHKSLILSIAAAGGMVLIGLKSNELFVAILFGFLAYQNFVQLQQERGHSPRSPW